MSTIFISHSSADQAVAQDLAAQLRAQGHLSIFLDLDPEQGIQAGASWERTLYTKLRGCRVVIALCTDNYLTSHWCFAEIALARMEGKEIFALRAAPWSDGAVIPAILGESQHIDLRSDPDAGYKRLWLGFSAGGILPTEHRSWTPHDPPYPGLRAFDEKDAPVFFGRQREIQEGVELITRVHRQGHPRLVLVLGASGSGKSSLVKAGILPELRRDPTQWRLVGPLRPGPQPTRELAAALAEAFTTQGREVPWEDILLQFGAGDTCDSAEAAGSDERTTEDEVARDRLRHALATFEHELTGDDTQLAESVRHLQALLAKSNVDRTPTRSPTSTDNPLFDWASRLRLQGGPSQAAIVLAIDQFEELLGHEPKGPDHPANLCLALIRRALDAEGSPLLLLATMRSDYLEAFQTSSIMQGVAFSSMSVGPMSRDGMRQVIEEPAKLGQIALEPGLTELLLDDTGSSDALPLLAFTLRVMWDRYHGDRLLEIREYREIGGLQGAVARVAEETLDTAMRPGDERTVRDAFLGLARPTEEGSGWARQAVSWDRLSDAVQRMLQPFINQRLLVRREDGSVEVAHEALFRSWHRLAQWLEQDREFLLWRKRLGLARREWERLNRDRTALLSGPALAEARGWSDRKVGQLDSDDSTFVGASSDAARKRRQHNAAALTAVLAFLIAVAVTGVALWRNAESQRQLAEQRRAEGQELLAKGLLNGISGSGRRLTSREAEVLWDLATLRDSDLRVRTTFLGSALRSEGAAVQLRRHREEILQALVGLNDGNRQELRKVVVDSLLDTTTGIESLLTSMQVAADLNAYTDRATAVAAERTVAAMTREGQRFQLSSIDVLARLGTALGALGTRLPPGRATEAARVLVQAMRTAREQHFGYRLGEIASALGALGDALPVDSAKEAVDVLLPEFHGEGTSLPSPIAIGPWVAMLSQRLPEGDVRQVADNLMRDESFRDASLHRKLRDEGGSRSASMAAGALAAALRVERDANRRSTLGALLVICMSKQLSPDAVSRLKQALADLMTQPAHQAIQADLGVVLEALEKGDLRAKEETESFFEAARAEEKQRLAASSPPETAASLLEQIARAKEPYRRSELALALGQLSARLPRDPTVTGDAVRTIVGVMRPDFDVVRVGDLVTALASLGDGLPVESAVEATRLLIAKSDTKMETNDVAWEEGPLLALGRMAAVVPQPILGAVVHAMLRLARSGGDGVDLRAAFAGLAMRSDARAMVELLKQPLCVGKARSEVLRILEEKTGDQFHDDIWQLVARADRLGIDPRSPPQRPQMDWRPIQKP